MNFFTQPLTLVTFFPLLGVLVLLFLPSEKKNLVTARPEQVETLLRLLDQQVRRGRCTPGEAVSNDREITFLPAGVTLTANVGCVAAGNATCGTVTGLNGQASFGTTGTACTTLPTI